MIDAVIFDWKHTLYDPDRRELIAGTTDVLEYLGYKAIKAFLVGKGGNDMYSEVARLGIRSSFSSVFFKDGPKDLSVFAELIDSDHPDRTLVIGDRVRSEIQVGNELGVQTIQVRRGPFAGELPEIDSQIPSRIVTNLGELLPLMDAYTT